MKEAGFAIHPKTFVESLDHATNEHPSKLNYEKQGGNC